jgi:hypothetical protein
MLVGNFEEERKLEERREDLKHTSIMAKKSLSEFSLKIFYAIIKNIFS